MTSIMLHGLKAVHERLPGDLQCSLSPAHVFGEKWLDEGSARGWSWHSRKREAEAALALMAVTSASSLVAFRVLSLVLAGVELQPLCSPLLLLPCFSTSAVPLPHIAEFHIAKRSFCSYVHMLNISLSSACLFFFFNLDSKILRAWVLVYVSALREPALCPLKTKLI